MLGTSDTWSMIRLSNRPSDPVSQRIILKIDRFKKRTKGSQQSDKSPLSQDRNNGLNEILFAKEQQQQKKKKDHKEKGKNSFFTMTHGIAYILLLLEVM